MSTACLFCGIAAGTIPSVTVAQDDDTVAFMDINPGSDGHVLVIPRRHSADVLEIPADDLAAVTRMAQRVARAAVTTLGADGVNLLNCCGEVAWQSVFHFHMHVIPRYDDPARDRLRLPWTPDVPGDAELIARLGGGLAAALAS